MAFDSVRGYVQLASGLGELTRARAMEAAEGLLSIPGLGDAGRVAGQASALGDELLTAARANRTSLVALIRQELESALARAQVARAGDLESAKAVISLLSMQVDELRRAMLARENELAADPADIVEGATIVGDATVADEVEGLSVAAAAPTHSSRRAAARRSATKTPPTKTSATEKPASKKSATKKSATKKPATKKPATKKSATTAKKTAPAAGKTATKRATTKKSS